MTGELGAEVLIFNVPLIAFVVPTAEGAETRVSVDSLLFRLGPMLTATMFLLPVVIKVFGFTPDEDGAMITNVGPLLPDNDCCLEEEAPEVVEATTSGKLTAGGLGEDDLNLLSRIESNSANCSIVLEDMDLTIVCPIFVVVEPFSVVVEELD